MANPAPARLVTLGLVAMVLARSAPRPTSRFAASSVKPGGFQHNGGRDILTAFDIANNERHGHQLPSIQIIDRDVASQVPVVKALTCIALNQDNRYFGIVHAKTSRTLRSAPANKKTYELAPRRHN